MTTHGSIIVLAGTIIVLSKSLENIIPGDMEGGFDMMELIDSIKGCAKDIKEIVKESQA